MHKKSPLSTLSFDTDDAWLHWKQNIICKRLEPKRVKRVIDDTRMCRTLPMGNPSQVQQQVFVQGLQPHLMQAQGIMHQGHAMNFSSQMGTHLGFFAHA